MKTIPYLTFDGTGREAAEFYAKIFGGKIAVAMSFGEMPDQPDWVTDETKDRLAHATVMIDGAPLMISDTAGIEPFKGHSGFSLNLSFDSVAAAAAVFDKIAADGTVKMPFAKTFWAAGFGVVRDRFGVEWMCNCERDS